MKAFSDGRWLEVEDRKIIKDWFLATEKVWRWPGIILMALALVYYIGRLLL